MLIEFAGIQLTREELQRLHSALLLQEIVKDEIRREHGAPHTDPEPDPLLERVESLLGADEDALHQLDHEAQDRLWEYSWYAFTDEWAWYRAQQDVLREIPEAASRSPQELEAKIDLMYTKKFESYVMEIDMKSDVMKAKRSCQHQPKSAGKGLTGS